MRKEFVVSKSSVFAELQYSSSFHYFFNYNFFWNTK